MVPKKENEAKNLFAQNLITVISHNNDSSQNKSFLLELNQFSDISNKEFVQTYLGFVPAENITIN